MSNKINTGGPAFPFEYHNQTSRYQESFHPGGGMVAPDGAEQYSGITTRDYFAAKAMQAVLADPITQRGERGCALEFDEFVTEVACAAYKYADAMLIARGE